jgi:hypothetical protein
VPPDSCPEVPAAAVCGSKPSAHIAAASLLAPAHAPAAAAHAADVTAGMYGGFDSFQELVSCAGKCASSGR